jgi:hypothetical protein
MERIYLSYTGKKSSNGRVRVNLFLKEVPEDHKTALKTFLVNQNIVVSPLENTSTKIYYSELSYFDDGFEISYSPHRWQFYAMRDYIYTYLRSWEVDLSFASKYFKEFDTTASSISFSDKFYVDLSRFIDSCEDNYYIANRSIAIFLNGILKILKDNLQLYFACAVLQDYNTGKIEYINYTPETIPKKNIIHEINTESNSELLNYPVVFNKEHIADFYLHLSPYSPSVAVIKEFLDYMITMIDDFIYADVLFRKETFRLKARIAELEGMLPQYVGGASPHQIGSNENFQEFDKSRMRLILIGAGEHLKKDKIFIIISKAGYDKKRVEVLIEYDKMKSLDINNLKKIRSRYDGILLGPMPHKMHGDMSGESLIGIISNSPEEYPPFVIIQDKSENLKISKSSLKDALNRLGEKMEKVNSYAEVL